MSELEQAYELLKEKFNRHEKILVQAYKSLKQKENDLKVLNNALLLREEELKAALEELTVKNEELCDKNKIIEEQNFELKTALNNLKDTQFQLIQSEKMASLGIMTAGIAHEINNPLNFITASCFSIKRHIEKLEIQNPEYFEELLYGIEEGIDRVSDIVLSLTEFSRSNSKKSENCSIHKIIDNCLNILHNKLKRKTLIERKYSNHQIYVIGNNGKLHQIFLNIILNAYQAIEDKGKIIISTEKNAQFVYIKITDDGIGISEENIDKIMDPFFTTKEPGKGTGLGLSIAYNIIKEHKGSINFESSIGRGTSVNIQLPLIWGNNV